VAVAVRSLVGAHVPVSGGLARGAARAEEIGAEVVQIFAGNPRGWAETPVDPAADDAFRAACAARLMPVFVHAPYLINFGSPADETLTRSARALAFALCRADTLGAAGVVVHAGSAVSGERFDVAMKQVREHVLPLLDGARTRLLIEPTAGGGGALASTVDSLAAYLDVLDDERVGVCLDTCHLHAAGHDVSTRQGMARTLAAVVRAIGRGRIGLVHANDSRDPAGSKRDRHAGLGDGTIGLVPFAALFTSPATRKVPFVVETAPGDHARDIAALKSLRGG
jgi:deoxyribonuclease-4